MKTDKLVEDLLEGFNPVEEPLSSVITRVSGIYSVAGQLKKTLEKIRSDMKGKYEEDFGYDVKELDRAVREWLTDTAKTRDVLIEIITKAEEFV
jgi:hypothetical protein